VSLASIAVVARRAGCPGMGPTQMGAVFYPCSPREVSGAWDSMRWRCDVGGAPASVCTMVPEIQ
jgi:hypothetical protein